MRKDELNVAATRPAPKTNNVLVSIMYVEWIIMAFLMGLVFVRLVYSSDRNWLYFVLLMLLTLLLLVPVLISVSYVQESATGEQQKTITVNEPQKKRRRKTTRPSESDHSSSSDETTTKARKQAIRRVKTVADLPILNALNSQALDMIVVKETEPEQKPVKITTSSPAKPKSPTKTKKQARTKSSARSETTPDKLVLASEPIQKAHLPG